MNRRIVVYAEGATERAAKDHLKRFLDGRAAGEPKVRLQIIKFDGALSETEVSKRAAEHLRSNDTLGIVALTDLFPKFPSTAEARRIIKNWMPKDPRCHVHVAKFDFEAWLLVGWDAILRKAGVERKKPWGQNPEEIDGERPPAHRIAQLFREGKSGNRYIKPVDGKALFEQLDLLEVAAKCPEFKEFLNCLLGLAKYPLID